MGCVQLYCGDGKGKTTAAVGQAVRTAGSGGRAVIARFLKNDDSGEVAALRLIPNIRVLPCEKSFGFTWQMTEAEKAEAAEYYEALLLKAGDAARETVQEMTREMTGDAARELPDAAVQETAGEKVRETARELPVLLVLDEVCAAVNSGLLKERSVLELLDGRPERLEVVMTGRDPSDGFLQRADYISRIEKIRHPFDAGLAARKGIEY